MADAWGDSGCVPLLPGVFCLAQLELHAFARQKTPESSYLRQYSIGLGMARSSCAVLMELLEGMGL